MVALFDGVLFSLQNKMRYHTCLTYLLIAAFLHTGVLVGSSSSNLFDQKRGTESTTTSITTREGSLPSFPFNISYDEYETLDAETKQTMWWDFITQDEDTETIIKGPPQIMKPSILHRHPHDTNSQHSQNQSENSLVFDFDGDYRPFSFSERKLHQDGAIAKIEFIVNDDDSSPSPYSGIFKSGSSYGLIRFSGAQGVRIPFVPSLGLKFFRNNGVHSGNLIMGAQYNKFFSFDFFGTNQLSHFHSLPSLIILSFNAAVESLFSMVGSADVAMYDENGNMTDTQEDGTGENELSFPYELVMRPTQDVQEIFGTRIFTRDEYVKSMERIPSNITLYEVFARDHSDDSLDDMIYLGFIRMTSNIIFSANAEKYLFFRHNRMSIDMDLLGENKDWSGNILCPLLGSRL